MYIETWHKSWCPECKATNWTCEGDINDLTGMSAEAIECHACGKKFAFDEDSVYYDFESEDAEATNIQEWIEKVAYCEKGLPIPT